MNTSMDSTENIHSIPQHLEVKIEQEEEAGQLSTREKDQSTISPLPESQEISPKQPPTPTPLPWAKLFVVFFMYLCDSLSITSLFPYISFMVADFNLTDNPTEYGYYVGLVASSYFLSQFISSFIWGYLSDLVGRRPVLLSGVCWGAFCVMAFGFSKWFWWACVCRFMFGLLNGNLGVTKSYLGEITDSTNQTRAFALTSITFGISSVLGPLVGGVFSRPHAQYPRFMELFPEWIQNISRLFPYIIPNLIISALAFTGFTIGYFRLQETNKNGWYYRKFCKTEPIADLNDDSMNQELSEMKTSNVDPSNKKNNSLMTSPPTMSMSRVNLLSKDGNQENTSINDMEELEEETAFESLQPRKTLFERIKQRIKLILSNEMLSSAAPLTTCTLYMLLGAKQVMFDECLPLLAVMPIDKGGMGMTSYQLGLVGGLLGFVIILHQVFIAHHVIKRFTALYCYRTSLLADIIMSVIFPEIIWLVADDNAPTWRIILFWITLIVSLLLRQVSNGYSFLGSFLFTNNSVSKKNYGKLNGTAQSMVALSRMISPVVGGAIFASSVSSSFVLRHRVIFYIIAAISMFMLCLSFVLNASINKPKEETKSSSTTSSPTTSIERSTFNPLGLFSYDRGHLVANNDLRRATDKKFTFLVINKAAQNSNVNRGIWRHVEHSLRNAIMDVAATKKKNIEAIVVTRPLYDKTNMA
ncbi:hypothetical protein FDP41_007066 [Naegleria fowleri]|uniref:Major facilitator superfamily (MFS) profile domain-containing protein n=1 Tax=Naegleria fowleri TaxID=5763 RepID=A0A6A5BLB5_NAEFO|nr:uncharacterized protein FDP41_007066 [Naegleria fowleri]KAF0973679.1 hypothetical protein FDP41_007066 [Naegleria fowleri]